MVAVEVSRRELSRPFVVGCLPFSSVPTRSRPSEGLYSVVYVASRSCDGAEVGMVVEEVKKGVGSAPRKSVRRRAGCASRLR